MLNRISYILWFAALAIAAYLYFHFTRSGQDRTPTFTGSASCRACHESMRTGDQFDSWTRSSHSRAYNALKSDSAIRYLQQKTVPVDSCISCHSTTGRKSSNQFEQAINSEGVGCERCHGAGSEYSFFNVMRDSAAFNASGGLTGTLGDCYQCHARAIDANTRHCPFQTIAFNADSGWRNIEHHIPEPAKEALPDTVKDLRKDE